MKRRRFTLNQVLKHYEMQKRMAEQALQQAAAQLRQADAEIEEIARGLNRLRDLFDPDALNSLSSGGWAACWRQSNHLTSRLAAAQERRRKHAQAVAAAAAVRRRWAIAEETLVSLRENVDQANRNQEAKAQHLELQEAILRNWHAIARDAQP